MGRSDQDKPPRWPRPLPPNEGLTSLRHLKEALTRGSTGSFGAERGGTHGSGTGAGVSAAPATASDRGWCGGRVRRQPGPRHPPHRHSSPQPRAPLPVDRWRGPSQTPPGTRRLRRIPPSPQKEFLAPWPLAPPSLQNAGFRGPWRTRQAHTRKGSLWPPVWGPISGKGGAPRSAPGEKGPRQGRRQGSGRALRAPRVHSWTGGTGRGRADKDPSGERGRARLREQRGPGDGAYKPAPELLAPPRGVGSRAGSLLGAQAHRGTAGRPSPAAPRGRRAPGTW